MIYSCSLSAETVAGQTEESDTQQRQASRFGNSGWSRQH